MGGAASKFCEGFKVDPNSIIYTRSPYFRVTGGQLLPVADHKASIDGSFLH